MTSTKPYLVRAMYEWILDNGMTPHLVVDVRFPGVHAPREFVEDGRLVLNLSPSAVRGLVLGNDEILFNARFGGVARDVAFPVDAVLGIFTRENGQGMVFPEVAQSAEGERGVEDRGDVEDPPTPPAGGAQGATKKPTGAKGRGKGGPTLKVVK